MCAINRTALVIILNHPHGDLEVPLEEWISQGPGARPYVKPVSVRRHDSDEELPLNMIPFRYRNSSLSRFLIRIGVLTDPWKS